jgi:hypothetical protein
VIEQVPQELRDRFTEMRELDLTVQSKLFGVLQLAMSIVKEC